MNENVPLAINQNWIAGYLIPPDEVVLFEFLLYKQNYFGASKYYYYSQRKLVSDLKIKRTRLETILKKFEEMGFLHIVIENETTTNNKTTYFNIDFKKLSKEEVLSRLIDARSDFYSRLKKWAESIKC